MSTTTPPTGPSPVRHVPVTHTATSAPEPEGAPLSRLAIGGAVSAVPLAPLGIVLCSVALRQVRQGRVRGHALAVAGLTASIVMSLVGVALVGAVAAFLIALIHDVSADLAAGPGGAAGAVGAVGGSGGGGPLDLGEIPTSCTHDSGSADARVDWSAGSLALTRYRTEMSAAAFDASGAEVGRRTFTLDPKPGKQEGVIRVRVDPNATVSSCTLGMKVFQE